MSGRIRLAAAMSLLVLSGVFYALVPSGAAAAGSFVRVDSLTTVANPNAPELTIDAAGGTATWDHCGSTPNVSCDGGNWTVNYTFTVPPSLTPGANAAIPVGIAVSNVKPEQPLFIQMSVRAPDFAKTFSINYPNPASDSTVFGVPILASQQGAPELTIIVDVVSAEITYHYASNSGPDGASRRSAGNWSRSVGTLEPGPASGPSQPSSSPTFHRIAQSVRAAREEPRDGSSEAISRTSRGRSSGPP